MPIKLQLQGEAIANPTTLDHLSADGKPLFGVSSRQALKLDKRRSGSAELHQLAVDENDPVCVRMADGFEWWMSAKDAALEFHSGKLQMEDGVAICPIDPEQILSQGEGNKRGAASHLVQSIEAFGVDFAKMAAKDIAQWLEKKQLAFSKTGLFQLALDQAEPVLSELSGTISGDDTQKPILLFIHGTASSTKGSFGELWQKHLDASQPNGPGEPFTTAASVLHAQYGNQAYAFEYTSISASPISNVLALAQSLPAGAQLHLVSHSQGGLLGELLCLAQCEGGPPAASLLEELFARDRSAAGQWGLPALAEPGSNGYAQQLADLQQLLQLLAEKKFHITRFVRVACPALGTTLVSGKLDRWLSVLKFIARASGNVLLAADLLALIMVVIKQRCDPRTLPGLEGMMPGSALQRLLNHNQLRVSADLTVIAGDIEDKSIFGWLKLVTTDLFFASRNDLVVNTGSMYGGLRRTTGQARAMLDQGKQVSHFNYFANLKTVKALLAGLTRQGPDFSRFTAIDESQREEPARSLRPAKNVAKDGAQPLAIFLPGIMGSHLAHGTQRIWLDLLQLAGGGMGQLQIDSQGIAAEQLLDSYYGQFCQFLAQSHEVQPFPYDWRQSIQHNAKLLAQLIEKRLPELERQRQPLRLVAHSMGGLIARVMLAQYPDLWRRLKLLPGFRLLMLGTPNFGSYQSLRLLLGQHHVSSWLALLDLRHDEKALLRIISGFPGAYELLPVKDKQFQFLQSATWKTLQQQAAGDWSLPADSVLQRAAQTQALLQTAPIDPKCMIYIAGWAKQTPSEMAIEAAPNLFGDSKTELRFYSTRRGDGTVCWDMGMLPGVATYFVEHASHDQLLNYEPVFSAYLELLTQGSTRRLPTQEPQVSRGGGVLDERKLMLPDYPQYQPTLDNFGGMSGPKKRTLPPPVARMDDKVKLILRHGDLAYALHPVCVGHYQGDTVVSAEKQLDSKLNGALKERAKLGIYPGRLGSWAVFFAQQRETRPAGAIVIGLGQVGELAPGSLEASMTPALIDYALQVANWHDGRFGDNVRQARVSFLLIGTGAGGISVQDSISVILRSVKKANQKLLEQSQLSGQLKSYIDQIEILELFHDVALQAAHALRNALTEPDLQGDFVWQPAQLAVSNSGLHRAQFDQAQSWWQRTEISFDHKRQELRFVALTNRARAEQSLVAGQMRLAKDFVRQAIGTTDNNQDISRTLFEMLVPNRLKEFAPERQDLVLLLDDEAAWFPWEMMEDRWSENGPPPAVAAGLIRQLKTTQYRAHPLHSSEPSILVVGNPRPCKIGSLSLSDLPGARQEAEMVVQKFKTANFQVSAEIESRADQILIALHGSAYRILHLAGHGVHQFETDADGAAEDCPRCEQAVLPGKIKVSGMVIGDSVFLTPADIEQMRWVPELVFINCCHLGTTLENGKAPRHNELAANIAAQFIRMGVKAVIAAGWEVNDAAACAFAEQFYQSMLDGLEFGHAVQRARQRIYDDFSNVNTWGAYQCYGDPDFRLTPDANLPEYTRAEAYFSSLELITDLHNLTQRARFGGAKESDLQRLLERIPAASEKDWRTQGDVCAALGQAYGELQLFAAALDNMETAIQSEKSDIPLSALEQRANFKARRAAEIMQETKPGNANEAQESEALKLFEQAIKELESLLTFAPTIERHNLLASTWKRRAWVLPVERQHALAKMRESYANAQKLGQQQGTPSSHAALNLLLAQILQAESLPLAPKAAAPIVNQCKEIFAADAQMNLDTPDFWAASALPQSILVAALAQGKLAEKRKQIIEQFLHARQPGASKRELSSVLDNLRFIASVLRDKAPNQRDAEIIEKIAAALEG